MSSRYLLVLLFLLTVQGVRAQTSAVKPGRSENPKEHRREIEHLVPVDPYYDLPELRKYAELKCKLLQIPVSVEQGVLMVCAPPFGPEECLFIHRPEKEGEPYAVVHTCADRSIWYSMPEHNDEGRAERSRGSVKVTR